MATDLLENVAIIILNYNNPELTIKATRSLIDDKRGPHVIVVDNFSKDNSKVLLEHEFKNTDKVHLIFNDVNYGYAHGNNIGIDYAEKLGSIRYVGIMNPDVILSIDIIDKLVESLEDNINIGFITTEVYYNGVCHIPNKCAWHLPTILQILTFYTILGYIASHFLTKLGYKYNSQGYYSEEHYKNKRIAFVDVVQGCFFMGKLSTFLNIEKLDSNTFLYYEENILASKIKKIGKRNAVLVANYIQHNHKGKDKKLLRIDSKIFDMSCLHKSRDYYIVNYSDFNDIIKSLLRIFLKIDFYFRKIGIKILYKN